MKVARRFLWMLALPLLAVEVPSGSVLQVRLTTPVSVRTAQSNQMVEGVVIAPVQDSERRTLIPSGTRVTGRVKDRRIAESISERAKLRIRFDRLTSPAGVSANVDARLVNVDNARESVDDKGEIIGILAAETLSARIDTGIERIAGKNPALGNILAGLKAGIVREANTDIQYEAGVEMQLRLDKPLRWEPGTQSLPSARTISPADDLRRLVSAQPFRTYSQNPRNPSDITNLMFIGKQRDIEDAFRAAGWTTATALSGESTMEAIRAVIEMRGYKEAPVSVLTLDGSPPDLVFQKQNNTFAQRHHLRIWRRPGTFHGLPVWVSSATHDIGIDFSEETRTFIHRIDPNIDKERAKVMSDLVFTGNVAAVSLVPRDQVPTHSTNGTGDPIITDGRMAALQFSGGGQSVGGATGVGLLGFGFGASVFGASGFGASVFPVLPGVVPDAGAFTLSIPPKSFARNVTPKPKRTVQRFNG